MIEERDLLLAAGVTFAVVVGILGVLLVLDSVSLARNSGIILVAVVGIAIEFLAALLSCRRWPWVDPRTPMLVVGGAVVSVSAFLPVVDATPEVRFLVFLLGAVVSFVGIAGRHV